MALAIDSSSPAIATSLNTVTTVTSPAFTPPAQSVLLVSYAANTGAADNPATPGITDNLGTPLTYTLVDHATIGDVAGADGQATMWSAAVATSASMAITVTNNSPTANNWGAVLLVRVITGADTAAPVGAKGVGGSVTNGAKQQDFTATRDGSQGFLVVADWDVTGAETAGTGCTFDNTGNGNGIGYGFLRRTTADGVAGATTSMLWTIPGASVNNLWVYAEVLPAGGNPFSYVGGMVVGGFGG
jgi:hypothetical protein